MKNRFLLPALMAGLGLTLAGGVTAQTFTVLHHFHLSQGGQPFGRLTLSGNTLYGATYLASNGNGVLFSVSTNGTSYNVLHTFSALNNDRTNTDGATPECTLKLAGNKLYGTATRGGTLGNGVVYSVNLDGTGFTTLFNFSGAPLVPGSYALHSPVGELVLAGETLYGVTRAGGSPAYDGSVAGRIFAVNITGGGTIPYAFPDYTWDGNRTYSPYNPTGGLVLLDNKFYGITTQGGYDNNGTVFTVNTDGSGFSILHYFTSPNLEGTSPIAPLVLSGNTLYGTTHSGGSGGRGVIFAINVNGSDFTVLHAFNGAEGYENGYGLLVSGDTLYGSTNYGGSTGDGTLFSMKTDGTAYTVLHSFDRYIDGKFPRGLIQAGNTLYGMAGGGGTYDTGTIFAYVAGPAITSVAPNSGPAAGGQSAILSGTNLSNATAVTFGGTAATIGSNTDTSITITTPAHGEGAVNVVVTTAGGSATRTNGYTFVPGPTITSISPDAGPVAGGQSVTINGTNLSTATSVTLGGTAATITAIAGNSVTVTTPAHAAGAVNVVVTTGGGSGTSSGGYTYGTSSINTPIGVEARAVSGTRVDIGWIAVTGAISYQIDGRAAGGVFVQIGTSPTNSFSDTSATAGSAFLYRVRAVNGTNISFNSASDLATTVIFMNDPLVAGMMVKAVHLAELRTAINAVRALAGVGQKSFADTTATATTIKAVHVTELRSALDEARATLGFSSVGYSDSSLSGVVVKVIHLQELHNRVQ